MAALLERLKINLISFLGYWAIRIVCSTLRWEVPDPHLLDSIRKTGKRSIIAFWHGRIFMCTYYFRDRGIVVMTSWNRDGEYIARVIQRFGYGVARGSSNRGSLGATVECLRALRNGSELGIAIDGPRGPRYVAKPGAAYIARKSGNPVVPMIIAVEKKWLARSWDLFQVPIPFSRAVVLLGAPIYVDSDASDEEIKESELRIQHSLDALRERADGWWQRERTNGSAQSPA